MNKKKDSKPEQLQSKYNFNFKILINNSFIPNYLKTLIPKDIDSTSFKNFNFAFIYRYPNTKEKNNVIRFKINDKLDIYKWDKKFLSQINEKYKKSINKLNSEVFRIVYFKSKLSWRMVIGLGDYHPQETSMTLHHIYGIPYIPGSAIKGVTRHWVISNLFDEIKLEEIKQIRCLEKLLDTADLQNKDENKRDDKLSKEEFEEKFKVKLKENISIIPDNKLYDFLKNQHEKIIEFQKIFGTQSNKGNVIFFDAYPYDEINLKIDLITPHYGRYYQEGKPPADHNPIPIKFLTVENTKFEFNLGSKSSGLLQKAELWLKRALQNYGIGAKTAIGYGYFEIGL